MEISMRKETRKMRIGDVWIGGGHSIAIQSMTNTDTRDAEATINQILALQAEGCEIVRVAVPDMAAAEAVKKIKSAINIPLVCDIHFDYRLAIASIESGADKIRLNPGNIGDIHRIKQVVNLAKSRGIPIRIGINGGSLEADIFNKHGGITAAALVESAMRHVRILEDLDYDNIAVSIKASSVPLTVDAYKSLSDKVDYPLHIGVTETGTFFSGSIKSAVGLGILLNSGIGDTIRVSLTGDPLEEVKVAKEILKSLELRRFGVEIISCPTCGRCRVNLSHVADEVERRCKDIDKYIKVAVMGCAVNGPGEARDADVGVACGDGKGLIFRDGQILHSVPEDRIVEALLEEIRMK